MLRWSTLAVLVLCTALSVFGQPAPTPDAVYPNVWYGAVPPGGTTAPVLVFIHGLSGTASYFWTNNDMYSAAYTAGYRTAFISMNADNSSNTATIAQNGLMIKNTLSSVARAYQTKKLIMVGHSKGGLDIQYAVATYSGVRGMVRAIFTLGTPNQGAQMADWAYGPGKSIAYQLGLLSPGMSSLKVATVQTYRAAWDPIFTTAGIPFFYVAGTDYTGNTVTSVTGPILLSLSGQANDGLVTPTEATLPAGFATTMGTVPHNHYALGTGAISFPIILPYLLTL